MGQQYHPQESCCTIRKLCSLLVTMALLGTGIGLAVYFLLPGGKEYIDTNVVLPKGLEDLPKDLWDQLPQIEIFHGESPWAPGLQQNPDDASKWNSGTNGHGLTLEIRNALSSEWNTYFVEAVQNWDNGSPDSLTLETSTAASPLPDCPDDQADGIMLVCNDDYGETDWKGINKVLLQNNWIVASTARMNDRFFNANGGDDDKRLYTMCHEIGHGFGLPHTDETFWNRDLGNCLDYTTRYSGNMRPDQSNYDFLVALYGTIGGGSSSASSVDTTNTNNVGTRRQLLRPARTPNRRHRGLFHDVANPSRRRELLAELKQVDDMVNRGLHQNDPRWRLLHRSEGGEAHVMDLGEGYTVEIHLLHA